MICIESNRTINAGKSDIPMSVKVLATCDGGKVLVLKDAYSDWHDLPGGHVHDGESPADALEREVMEETGLHVNDAREIGAKELVLGGKPRMVIFYTAKVSGEPKLSHEHEGAEWVNESNIAQMNLGVFEPMVHSALVLDGLKKLEAAAIDSLDDFINEAQARGALPHLTEKTLAAMKKNLTKYFTRISQNKVQEFADKAKKAVEDALREVYDPQSHDALADFVDEILNEGRR